ncbi:T9SS type A sorting domain-containing protein [Cloacibacterium sp. Arc13]|uniref:T9SS type A sorting domain-containing protein n=1 Tax=unclassified Cloacibacterium TaxID=2620870 RepID=UPI00352F1AFE
MSQALFSQAVFTSKGNGNWNSASTWILTSGTDADGIPDADDAVIIRAHTITVNVNATCSSLTTEPLANNTSGLLNITTSNASNININTNQLLTITGEFLVKANNSYNHVTILTGPGYVIAGSLTIGNDIAVSAKTTTTLAVRTTANFTITGDVNLYTNVDGGNNNRATFRHDSGTISINGQMIMTQENNGSYTQYNSNLGERQGTLILKNPNPISLNPLGGTQLSQLQPIFTGCTVQYSPTAKGLTLFNTNYRDLKIDSNYAVDANNLTINSDGNLYLINGIVNGNYTLNTNATIIMSNGEVVNPPTLVSGGTYNLTYAQHVDRIIAGPELIPNSTQLETLTISNTNGVQIDQICLPNQLIVTASGDLTGTGDVRVRTLFDVPAAVTFNTGGIITLVSTIDNTARVASLTNNPTINGNVTVERFLTNQGRKWRLVTAPLKGNTNNSVFYNWQNNGTFISGYGTDIWGPNGNPAINGLQQLYNSSHSLRRFNNSSNNWTNITNSFTEELFTENINKGFLIFATHPYGEATDGQGYVNPNYPQLTTTLKATGNLITGNVNYTDVPSTGFFIVGNPYASPIDFKTILNDSSNSGISKKIWFIDPTLGSYGAYVTWDNINGYSDYTTTRNPGKSSNPSNQTTIIQSGEAFFVKAITGTSTLTIKEAHKSTTNSNSVINRKADVTSERIRVTLEKQESNLWNKKDAIVVGFYAGGNSAYDTNDVQKMSNPNETLSFITDTRSLSSEHRAPIQDKEFLTLKLAQTTANTNYKLKIFAEDFTFTGQAFLEDTFLKTSTPIALDGSIFEYEFQITPDALSTGNRFKINFQASTLGTTTPKASTFVIYPNPTTAEKGINISFESSSSSGYHYKLFNPAGQLIEANSIISVNNKLGHIAFNSYLKSGVYYINLYDQNNELKNSQTIIIQ